MNNETQIDGAFLRTFQTYNDGQLLTDLSEALSKCSLAVTEHGKPASMTLKITLKPAAAGGALVITDEVTTKMPKGEPRAALFFAMPDTGELVRDNPKQMKLGLKVVDGGIETERESLKQASAN